MTKGFGKYRAGVMVYNNWNGYMSGLDEDADWKTMEEFKGGQGWSAQNINDFVAQRKSERGDNPWGRGLSQGFWVKPAQGRNFLL